VIFNGYFKGAMTSKIPTKFLGFHNLQWLVSAVFFFPCIFGFSFLYFGPVFLLLLARVWVSLLGFGEGLFGFVGRFFCFFGLGVFWGLL
jgi:hypothetical protein